MKKTQYLIIAAIIAVFGISCNEDTSDTIGNNLKNVEILENNILKFKDQETFEKFAKEGLRIDNFYSIANIYYDALKDGDNYYEREGGYEEFKEKYSTLYFPEVNNDYSAFLPVSDENIAYLINVEGNVYIGDELKNYIDINSWSQLVALGKTEPDFFDIQTRSDYFVNGMSTQYNDRGDRKVWVNMNRHKQNAIPYLHIEVCFRKKSLGIWRNYTDAETILSNFGLYPTREGKNGSSSHDYYYLPESYYFNPNIPNKGWVVINGVFYWPPIDATTNIWYRGTGKTYSIRISMGLEKS